MSPYAYVLRRVLYVIPTLVGVTFLIFLIFNVVSGDPALVLLGKYATPKQVLELHHELGLDKPLWVQYCNILKSVFTFDFGHSWVTKQRITTTIRECGLVSLTVSVPAFILSALISIFISLISAFFRGRWADKLLVVICVILMSVSVLAYILMGQWILAYKLGWFEIAGYENGFPDFLPFVILPVIITVVLSIGHDVRFYRTMFVEEIGQDYVRTAKAKGLSNRVILFKHVLRNAMVPIISNLVTQIPSLILGSVLIENFFGIPGLGRVIVHAINYSDFPVIKTMTILSSVLYIFFNLIADILYPLADPRVSLR